jgi:hypothetical protein
LGIKKNPPQAWGFKRIPPVGFAFKERHGRQIDERSEYGTELAKIL